MTAGGRGPEVRVERRVAASREAVYEYLTDSTKWARWQGASAVIDAVPGGAFGMTMPDGMQAGGAFVELVPNRRVVFTWGWHGHPTLPPGSSTVTIDLLEDGAATVVRIVHDGLPTDERAGHETGWRYYLPRLETAAAGGDPGMDPGAA